MATGIHDIGVLRINKDGIYSSLKFCLFPTFAPIFAFPKTFTSCKEMLRVRRVECYHVEVGLFFCNQDLGKRSPTVFALVDLSGIIGPLRCDYIHGVIIRIDRNVIDPGAVQMLAVSPGPGKTIVCCAGSGQVPMYAGIKSVVCWVEFE